MTGAEWLHLAFLAYQARKLLRTNPKQTAQAPPDTRKGTLAELFFLTLALQTKERTTTHEARGDAGLDDDSEFYDTVAE